VSKRKKKGKGSEGKRKAGKETEVGEKTPQK